MDAQHVDTGFFAPAFLALVHSPVHLATFGQDFTPLFVGQLFFVFDGPVIVIFWIDLFRYWAFEFVVVSDESGHVLDGGDPG